MLSGVIIHESPCCSVALHKGSCRPSPVLVPSPGAREERHHPTLHSSWDTLSCSAPCQLSSLHRTELGFPTQPMAPHGASKDSRAAAIGLGFILQLALVLLLLSGRQEKGPGALRVLKPTLKLTPSSAPSPFFSQALSPRGYSRSWAPMCR